MKDSYCCITISPGCKNRCVFCPYDANEDPAERIKWMKKCKKDALKKIEDAVKNGEKNAAITGCDPIEYEFLVPMIKYMKSRGFENIRLNTHGRVAKGNEKLVRELVQAGITRIRVPIYGPNSEIHDSITQEKGSFDETLNLIKEAQRLDVELDIVTLILNQNKERVIDTVKLAESFNPRNVGIDVSHAYPQVKDHSFCIYYQDLPKYVKPVFEYAKERYGKVSFNDMPYCIVGEDSWLMLMPENRFLDEKPKKKLSICKNCKAEPKCSGFFEYNLGGKEEEILKPVQ